VSKQNRPSGTARRERLEQLRAEQRSRERRRAWLIYGITGLVVLAIIAGTIFGIRSIREDQQARADAAEAPLEGLQEYDDLSQNHVEGDVSYPQSPPVGGDHNPVWLNCGTYREEVPVTNVVHSLEHGAVWLSYQPGASSDVVSQLEEFASGNDYVVVSPYEGQESPVVATAWGLQLPLESADDPRLQAFVDKYAQGPQTPEPGAACYGGVGG
jgi:hypothetical protein